MIVARIVSGYGMGFINSTAPVLQSEFSPKASRGRYVCAQLSTLNFGIMMVYWIDYAFGTIARGAETSYTWRVPTILQCVFLIPMLFIALIIPETPRWLVAHNRSEEALTVLRKLNKNKRPDEEVIAAHSAIVDIVAVEMAIGSGSWKDLLHNDGKRFIISVEEPD